MEEKHKSFNNVESLLTRSLKLLNYVLIPFGLITTLRFHSTIDSESSFKNNGSRIHDVRKSVEPKSQLHWHNAERHSNDTGLFKEHVHGRKKYNNKSSKDSKLFGILKRHITQHVSRMQKSEKPRTSEDQPPDYSDLFDDYINTATNSEISIDDQQCKFNSETTRPIFPSLGSESQPKPIAISGAYGTDNVNSLSIAAKYYLSSALKRNPKLFDSLYNLRECDSTTFEHINDEKRLSKNGSLANRRKSVSFLGEIIRDSNNDTVVYDHKSNNKERRIQGSGRSITSRSGASRHDLFEQLDSSSNEFLRYGERYKTDDFECYFELELASITTGRTIAIVRHSIQYCSQFVFYGDDLCYAPSSNSNSSFVDNVCKAFSLITDTIIKNERFQASSSHNIRYDLPLLRKYTIVGVSEMTVVEYQHIVKFIQNTFQIKLPISTVQRANNDFNNITDFLLRLGFDLYRRNK